jgi:hypothetical protein
VEMRVHPFMVLGHLIWRESTLCLLTTAGTVQLADVPDGVDHLVLVVTDEARHAVFDCLGHTPLPQRNDRCPTRQRLDHNQTKRLGPADGEQERGQHCQEIRPWLTQPLRQ